MGLPVHQEVNTKGMDFAINLTGKSYSRGWKQWNCLSLWQSVQREQILQSKRSWISKKVAQLKEVQTPKPKEFVSSEAFFS